MSVNRTSGFFRQSSWMVIATFAGGFFMALVNTNAIPPWELADPNNPGLGILAVYIDSPTNGAVIQ